MATILQNHYVLAVHDLQRSARFFEDLGFQISSRPEGWIFVKKDNCMVMLGECRDDLPPAELGSHNYFGYLRVDDAASYFVELADKGVKLLTHIADKPWGMREFAIESPEGHRIMIGQTIDT